MVVEIDKRGERFVIRENGAVASLTFHVRGSTMSLVHTDVPPALRGRRVGTTLARAALDYARNRKLLVKPYCPFVAGYLERHPEYQPLVDPAFEPASKA